MELIPASDHQCCNSFLLKRTEFFFRTVLFSPLHMTPAWLCQMRMDTLWEYRKSCLQKQDTGTWDNWFSCQFFMSSIAEVNGSTYVREYITAATTTSHCVYPVIHLKQHPGMTKVKTQLWVLSFLSSILISYYEQSSPSTALKMLKPNLNTRFKSNGNYSNIKLNLKASLHKLILQWEHKIGYMKINHCLTLLQPSRQETLPPSPFQPIPSGMWFGSLLLPH